MAASHMARARELVAGHVAKALPESTPQIDPVFPGLASGNRARLFTVKLPGAVPREALDRLLSEMRDDVAIEYAELPSPKKAMSPQG